jgi:hypothetical protein
MGALAWQQFVTGGVLLGIGEMRRLIREQNSSRRVRHLSMKCGPDFEPPMFSGIDTVKRGMITRYPPV